MNLEIWSDVVCPYCYVGKRRIESALARFPHRERVNVLWKSFQLDPSAPSEQAMPLRELLAGKYDVSVEKAEEMQVRVTAMAAEEGLTFDLNRARSGNTRDAHRLIHAARAHKLDEALIERFMKAYFCEGAAIGHAATLRALAIEVGLTADLVDSVLASDQFADAVLADQQEATSLGARGVPLFVMARAYMVPGAQTADVLDATLLKAWEAAVSAAD